MQENEWLVELVEHNPYIDLILALGGSQSQALSLTTRSIEAVDKIMAKCGADPCGFRIYGFMPASISLGYKTGSITTWRFLHTQFLDVPTNPFKARKAIAKLLAIARPNIGPFHDGRTSASDIELAVD